MVSREKKDTPEDDQELVHLNSGDVRNLKWVSDNVESAKKIFPYADELEEVGEARKWRARTHKYVKAILVFFATFIPFLAGAIAIVDKYWGHK